jgi:hypothetical protein
MEIFKELFSHIVNEVLIEKKNNPNFVTFVIVENKIAEHTESLGLSQIEKDELFTQVIYVISNITKDSSKSIEDYQKELVDKIRNHKENNFYEFGENDLDILCDFVIKNIRKSRDGY